MKPGPDTGKSAISGADLTALTFLLGAVMSLLPFAMDATLPGLPDMQASFSATVSQVQFVVTAYMLGIALGQLIFGPLSDRYGRRPVMLVALALYVVTAAASALVQHLYLLVGLRLLHGFVGVCGSVLARTVARDLLVNERAARLLARIMLVFAVATLVGPLIGGMLVTLAGWRSVFWLLTVAGAVMWVIVYRKLPETAPPERQPIVPGRIARNFAHLLSHREFLAPTSIALASQIGIYLFITNSALVFMPVLGYTPSEYALLVACVMMGHITGVQIGNACVLRHGMARMLKLGAAMSFLGGAMLVALAWGSVASGAAFGVAMGIFMVGNGLIIPNSTAAALSPFPSMAGAASSLQSVLYQIFGALAAILLAALSDGTMRPFCLGIGLAGMAVLACERVALRALPTAGSDHARAVAKP